LAHNEKIVKAIKAKEQSFIKNACDPIENLASTKFVKKVIMSKF